MIASLTETLAGKRRATKIASPPLLCPKDLFEGQDFGRLVTVSAGPDRVIDWFEHYRTDLERLLVEHGAILIRGFARLDEASFSRIVECFGPTMRYVYRSTPRKQLGPGVYTSTEYPATESIPLHNENSYALRWPRLVLFYSAMSASLGGETPLADSAAVFEAIDPAVRESFIRRGVKYIRNFGTHFDLDWREAFQTADRALVEAYCRSAGIAYEWRTLDRLRTWQVCPAVRAHPLTGRFLWFNQAHLFHPSSLGEELGSQMLAQFAEDDLPRTVRYGDGTEIEAAALDAVHRAYAAERRLFSWEDGDLLLLDNMRSAHGRRPYQGARRVLAGLVDTASEDI